MMAKIYTKSNFTFLTVTLIITSLINIPLPIHGVQFHDEKAVNCGDLVYWVRGGYFIDNKYLVVGGRELATYGRGYPFYICRVIQPNDARVLVGKFIKSEIESEDTPSQCWVTNGIEEIVYDVPESYEVLVDYSGKGDSLVWAPTNRGVAPVSAFRAGLTGEEEWKTSVFIGQCTIKYWGDDETTIPGAVVGSNSVMNVAFNLDSPRCSPVRVLVCKNRNTEIYLYPL